ncbi:MAG: DMT family transporter [Gammaproteobacteria bacterium]
MKSHARSTRFAVTVFAILVLIWGYNWIVMKVGLRYAGPFDFAALRLVCGTATLFVALAVTGRSVKPPPLGAVLGLGLLQTTAYVTVITWALVAGGAGGTSVLVFTMPFWALILGRFFLGERLRGGQWVAVLLAFVGLVLIVHPWRQYGSLESKLLASAGGFLWAASVIVAKLVRQRYDVDLLSLTAWQLLLGTVPVCLIAYLVPERALDWSWILVTSLLYAGILGTSAGWLIWMFVVSRLPAGTAGLSALAIPATAVLISWVQLGERPTGPEIGGMLCIAFALGVLALLGVWARTGARRNGRGYPAAGEDSGT